MDNKPDPRVGGFINKVSQEMQGKNKTIVYENKEEYVSEETGILLEEIEKLHRVISNMKREMKSLIREEFDSIMSTSTLITEGKGDEIVVMLGGHQFKGNVKLVKK